MPKRKSSAPARASLGKRQAMSWNLHIAAGTGAAATQPADLIVIDDSDDDGLPGDDSRHGDARCQPLVRKEQTTVAWDKSQQTMVAWDKSLQMPVAGDKSQQMTVAGDKSQQMTVARDKFARAQQTRDEHCSPLQGNFPTFDELLGECSFYVKLTIEGSTALPYRIGSFSLRLLSWRPGASARVCEGEMWLYVNEGDSTRWMLYGEGDHAGAPPWYHVAELPSAPADLVAVTTSMPADLFAGFRAQRSPTLSVVAVDDATGMLVVTATVSDAAFVQPSFPSEVVGRAGGPGPSARRRATNHLLRLDCEDFLVNAPRSSRLDLTSFYAHLDTERRGTLQSESVAVETQHPALRPVLRSYQRDAVAWMLSRERSLGNQGSQGQGDVPPPLHPLYTEVTTLDGRRIFYNKYIGWFVKERPVTIAETPGGILADEMGLGKTVEVLACILLHPRVNQGHAPLTDAASLTNHAPLTDAASLTNHAPLTDAASLTNHTPTNDAANIRKEKITDAGGCGSVAVDDAVADVVARLKEAVANLIPDGCTKSRDAQHNPLSSSSCHDNRQMEEEGSLKSFDAPNAKVSNQKRGNSQRPEKCAVTMKTEKTEENRVKEEAGNLVGKPTSKKMQTDLENNQRKVLGNFFKTNPIGEKPYFECTCGGQEAGEAAAVQCGRCGLWQHADCVNYDARLPTQQQDYYCPHCIVNMEPVWSAATLIVSPSSICNQWGEEIKKHVRDDTIRVMVYHGVQKQGFVQPATLAAHDIVITTYEAFKKEINYVGLPHSHSEDGRTFRHAKRFMAVPSPLVAVQWWRVCLDEAQMVESVSSHTAQMALRLTAVNRWCVTGTPIERGLDDLQGLLMFLGTDPYWEKTWWQKQLYLPYCHGNSKPMISAISRVLWRTAKKDVEEQIEIPAQAERQHWLVFSPVEEHFYRRQHEHCTAEATKNLCRWHDNNVKLTSLDRHTMQKLLHPLVRLRQACCHPQVVRGRLLPLQKTTMTMEELLDNLIKKAVTESEESHRQLISALNGLAALHVIQGALEEAVDYYRQALASIARHSDELKTDSLQRLHTLHNLHETLSQRHLGVAPTLRDATLAEEANTLRTRYLESAAAAVVTARGELREALTSPADLARACGDGDAPWWASVIERVIEEEAEDDVIQRIQVDLDSISHQDSIVNKFRTLRGLEYIIFDHMCALRRSHDDLQGALARLDRPPTSGAICEAVECHLRPASGNVQLSCDFCKADKKFAVYEAWLFDFRDRRGKTAGEVADPATRGHGTWADSEVERCLKLLLLSQARHMSREDRRDADAHVSYMRDLKKEFRCLRAMWMALSHHVSAHDELDMATTRLRLRCTGEQPPDGAALPGHVIEPRELGDHRLRLQADRVAAAGELRRRLGQLVYLRNLERTGYGKNGGSNPDPCPTCYKPLGTEWSVLPCAHCYCEGCMRVLVEQHSFGGQRRSTRCPVCREPAEHSHISHVSTVRYAAAGDSAADTPIKGSHSTKVEAIVRCLMNIQREDASAKSLVFSAWQDVLNIVGQALRENNITHRMLHANNKFQDNLSAFKHDPDISALLLPVNSGAKGLNLIEATHVLLVEPILNPANQLQAIGRVHRIGQTKATFVHHFLIRNTIEERMYNMLQSVRAIPMSSDTDDNALTIGDLTSLFNDED